MDGEVTDAHNARPLFDTPSPILYIAYRQRAKRSLELYLYSCCLLCRNLFIPPPPRFLLPQNTCKAGTDCIISFFLSWFRVNNSLLNPLSAKSSRVFFSGGLLIIEDVRVSAYYSVFRVERVVPALLD